jgi:hypothetical protein
MSKELKVRESNVLAPKPDFSIENLLGEAIRNKVDISTMERLLDMRRELKKEQAEEAYNKSMSEFQAECPIIKKDKTVMNKDKTTARYKFAPLDSIVKQTRELIKKHGFSYTFDTKKDALNIKAIVYVTHTMGHNKTSEFDVPIDPEAYMNQQQRFASALTFAKRYAFCNAFGILTGDEDNDAKSNDREEISEFEKVVNLIKGYKNKDSLLKMQAINKVNTKLSEKQRGDIDKMLTDKIESL